ncbi:hypothetical protein K7W42_22135 [Deinococcus sp. HMF7604]|uniref:hypothetical protein n=1 Tax=Deinococcus betulae TaxID=2873312 RepID=UPI001CCA8986|nr:hypothetical protein [Deinococcus betulae]MBZ9753535.1 hypothetical protein [Deinococcus betulae]
MRRRTGRAYRLYVSTSGGEARRNVRVGVVVRGLLNGVREEHPPRNARWDALPGGVLVGLFEVLGVGPELTGEVPGSLNNQR